MARKTSSFVLTCILSAWTMVKFVHSEENYCYMKDQHPCENFGSKTAYEYIHGNITKLPGCDVVFMWGLLRHGTRFAEQKYAKTIPNITRVKDEIIENHEIYKRGKLCSEDFQNLKNWTYNWNETMNSELTPQGEKDMKCLASRLKASFSSFCFSKENLTFKTSSKQRCKMSSIVFTNELLNNSVSSLKGNNISIDNKLLRIREESPSEDHIAEVVNFQDSDFVRKMLEEVSTTLGYEKNLTYDFVRDMYRHCAYGNAWIPHSRPGFCAAFTKDHLKIFEYIVDLKAYYALGYGDKNNARLSCSILGDLFQKLTSAKDCRNSSKKGAFYFAHSETLLPTFVQLDLFHDDDILKYDNYKTMGIKREWRTSLMDPFASNLIVVLYRCMGEFKVVFYINEKLMPFPGCAEGGCSMHSFEEIFTNKILKGCTRSGGSVSSSDTLSSLCILCYIIFNILKLL